MWTGINYSLSYFSVHYNVQVLCKLVRYIWQKELVFFSGLNYIGVLYCLLNDNKKVLKKFDPRTWCMKKPFGYRVIHHGYSLMSCPGLVYETCGERHLVFELVSFIFLTIVELFFKFCWWIPGQDIKLYPWCMTR